MTDEAVTKCPDESGTTTYVDQKVIQSSPLTPQSLDDGTHDIVSLRIQSSQKLKLAWESIYRKFEDAHLQLQDEIYLGSCSVKGDKMKIIRDRGHLRSLSKTPLGFGCFHIDKADLIGCDATVKQEEDEKAMEEVVLVKSEEDSPLQSDTSHVLPLKPTQRSVWPKEDPDLREFLLEEAKRREICGSSDSEGEEEEDIFGDGCVIDFTRPGWDGLGRQKKIKRVSKEDTGLEVYSLALASWDLKERSRETGGSVEGNSSPAHCSFLPTPPKSSHSSKAHGTPKRSEEIIHTPSHSSTKNSKGRSLGSSSSTVKRKRGAISSLYQEQHSPPSKQAIEGDCQGQGKCSKSLCLICGGS